MAITQALVAIGGKARRFRASGLPVPVSKAFLPIESRPALFWTLSALRYAGILDIILVGDDSLQFHEADEVLATVHGLNSVQYHRDGGLGVHGLPYHVLQNKSLQLHDSFVFECGHSLMTPRHYRDICDVKRPHNVVFTSFSPHPRNQRQPVCIMENGDLIRGRMDGCLPRALAHPMVIDKEYAARLPGLGFCIDRIIDHYLDTQSLDYVGTSLPPEFDYVEEYEDCITHFKARQQEGP